MSLQTDALPASQPASQPDAVAPVGASAARISELRRLYWSARREIWENRAITIAPLAVAALILLPVLYNALSSPTASLQVSIVVGGRLEHPTQLIQAYNIAAAAIMGVTFLVAIFYCLDALYGERRDRSILFWKSLPLSDRTTVCAKMIIPAIVLPGIAFAVTVVTQGLMVLINLAVFHLHGLSAAPLQTELPLLQMSFLLLYHLIAVQALWYAPIYAWLLMVSAWARRTPILWATLPPLALGVLEAMAFHTTHFFQMLEYRFSGPPDAAFTAANMSTPSLAQISPAHFFISPGLWGGLAVAAVFLAAAIRLRHYRNPI